MIDSPQTTLLAVRVQLELALEHSRTKNGIRHLAHALEALAFMRETLLTRDLRCVIREQLAGWVDERMPQMFDLLAELDAEFAKVPR